MKAFSRMTSDPEMKDIKLKYHPYLMPARPQPRTGGHCLLIIELRPFSLLSLDKKGFDSFE